MPVPPVADGVAEALLRLLAAGYGPSPKCDNNRVAAAEGTEPYLFGGGFVVRHIDPPSLEARVRPDEIVTAYDQWWPTRNSRVDDKADRKFEAACNRSADLEIKIRRTRARSIAGVLAKARVAEIADDSDQTVRYSIATSAMRDLMHLHGARKGISA
jgi:hypothetical protein